MNYTNNQLRESSTQEYALGLVTNYAVTKDEPTEVVLDNLTSSLDQQELVSYRFRRIGSVNSDLNIQNPSPVKSGVQYAVQIEETVRETRGDGTNVDHPLVMYLTVRHPRSGAVTASVLQETFERLLSALRYESDNSYRFADLARGALKPQQS